MGCAAGLGARGGGGEAGEVGFGEEERVEPVYAALVAGRVSERRLAARNIRTPCADSLGSISAWMPILVCAGR